MANMHRGKNYAPTLERGNDKKCKPDGGFRLFRYKSPPAITDLALR